MSQYRGRFAPTPSGPLHLGSLVTAVASFVQARSRRGAWLLRIDDLDRPRCPPGMEAEIRRQLEGHALLWDETIRYQTNCRGEYRAALDRLRADGRLFACDCTRAALRTAPSGPDGAIYPGTCRDRAVAASRAAWRLRVPEATVRFDDGWQGPQERNLARDVGDFVVQRADGVPAYQLACAVDEHAQRITEVVRGADLLGSTFQQLCVQRAIGAVPPAYRHLPVLVDAAGRKLSKQNHAPAVRTESASANLATCLALLAHAPPRELEGAPPAELLGWATTHWDAAKVPRCAQTRL